MLGVSVSHNQHLANVFYRLQLIETYGTGIMKINECYSDKAVKPTIEVSNNAFKITLPNLNYQEQITEKVNSLANLDDDRIKPVLSLFDNKESIVRKDVDIALGISQSTASILIRKMVEKGFLKKVGNGSNLKYKKC